MEGTHVSSGELKSLSYISLHFLLSLDNFDPIVVTYQKARSFFVLKVIELWETSVNTMPYYVHFIIKLKDSNVTG